MRVAGAEDLEEDGHVLAFRHRDGEERKPVLENLSHPREKKLNRRKYGCQCFQHPPYPRTIAGPYY